MAGGEVGIFSVGIFGAGGGGGNGEEVAACVGSWGEEGTSGRGTSTEASFFSLSILS